MQILTKTNDISNLCDQWKAQNLKIALVPTMGFHHEGHAALMRHARTIADKVVVSLFVNPTQFAPGEDFESYPRNLENDARIAQESGVDVLFAPTVQSMYSQEHSTTISLPKLSTVLCGMARPTHFQGVCTVVLKLFMITRANISVFGQKDWQQLTIIRQMVEDLNIPISIIGHPIVRESDGLALSSRNVYLNQEERVQAPEIYKGLSFAKEMVAQGETSAALLTQMLLSRWAHKLTLGRLDYLTIVHAANLCPVEVVGENTLMACAVRMGKARLLDNILL